MRFGGEIEKEREEKCFRILVNTWGEDYIFLFRGKGGV